MEANSYYYSALETSFSLNSLPSCRISLLCKPCN